MRTGSGTGGLLTRSFREIRRAYVHWSDSPLRLMGTIIVALLAIVLAAFPIAVPRAAASAGHAHIALSSGHDHHVTPEGGHATTSRNSVLHASRTDCGGHGGAMHVPGDAGCCAGMDCHSFQASMATELRTPLLSAIAMMHERDAQVAKLASVRLERPPRTA